MIKNIVFDMGDVLVDCDEQLACFKYTKDIDKAEEIYYKIFQGVELCYLESGIISIEEAWESFSKKFNDKETRKIAKKVFYNWPIASLWPIKGMSDVIKELKEKGYKLYILSNISELILKVQKKEIPCYKYFDGIFYSFESGYVKPQKDIYEIFLKKYKLKASECYFIDNSKWNISTAKKIGMSTFLYKNGDVKGLRRALKLDKLL